MPSQLTTAIHSVHNTGLLIKHVLYRDITLLSMKSFYMIRLTLYDLTRVRTH